MNLQAVITGQPKLITRRGRSRGQVDSLFEADVCCTQCLHGTCLRQRRVPAISTRGWIVTAVLTAMSLACLPAPSLAGISLSAKNRVVITEVGSFGTAEGVLTELLQQYLLLVLEKADLSGPDTEVTFILKSKAAYWHELPQDEVADIRDINAFEIAIRETPKPTVTITGQTPIATGHGVLFFLEKHLEILWAFPGELGLCLPKKRSFQLEEGTQSISPWIIARVMSGLLFRDGTTTSRASRAMTGVLRDQRAFFLADDSQSSRMPRTASAANPGHRKNGRPATIHVRSQYHRVWRSWRANSARGRHRSHTLCAASRRGRTGRRDNEHSTPHAVAPRRQVFFP